MKSTLSLTVLAVIGTTVAFANDRFLDTTPAHNGAARLLQNNVAWSSSLNCGMCVGGGYTFCVLGNEDSVVSSTTKTYCC
jgi:hypothetical protein